MECQQCGSCCRWLIVQIEPIDAMREPRVAEACGLPPVTDYDYENPRGIWGGMPAVLSPRRVEDQWVTCPFLTGAHCSIHPTRPNCCVAFAPGSRKCLEAREREAARNDRLGTE